MTPQDYTRVITHAHAIRMFAREVDGVDEALELIERAETVGPILDATLYQQRSGAMREDRDTLRAVRALAQLGART